MLIDFTIKNYTSFKDEKIFSYLCTSKKIKDDVAIESLYDNKIKTYPVSVVLGPNASGKTNIINALYDFRYFVLNSNKLTKDDIITIYQPFKLNTDSKVAPTFFDIEFVYENNHFEYVIEFNDRFVLKEELYIYNYVEKLTKSFLYKRDKNNLYFGSKYTGEKAVFKTMLLPNKLLLSLIGESNNESILQSAYNFFVRGLDIIYPQKEEYAISNKYYTETVIKDNPKFKSLVIALLKAADIQISDIVIDHDDNLEKQLSENYPNTSKILINNTVTKTYFTHPDYDNDKNIIQNEPLNFKNSESSGTKKLYEISASIIYALLMGNILIIDELSSCLHPNIEAFLISLFSSNETNTNGAQLLINTHNTNIIDKKDTFTKEQIWFTDKNQYGECDLYSLDEFDSNKIRDYAKYGKSYYDNRMGGLPNICFDLFKEELNKYNAKE
jgi:AAA15 family ATPase/GTPase